MVSFGSFHDEETCLNCGHLSSGLAHCQFSSFCYTFKRKIVLPLFLNIRCLVKNAHIKKS